MAQRLPEATGLGAALTELLDDPEAFVGVLTAGLQRLADEEYAAAQSHVAPGDSVVIGVRVPLLRAVARQVRPALRAASPATALWLAQRLAREAARELWLFSLVPLEHCLERDPERSWQLLRRLGGRCSSWVCVDTVAQVVARGVVLDERRWPELEQLVYSSNRWERRLVGSALARMPRALPPSRRRDLDGPRGLALIRSLIGDDDDQVQKALGWALRSWAFVDPAGVTRLLFEEADTAARSGDGHRARVVRDALSAQPPRLAREIRGLVADVRLAPGAPATSVAAAAVRSFGQLGELSERALREQGERMGRSVA